MEMRLEMRYADDTAILFKTQARFEKLVNSMKEHSENSSLRMNVKKTKSWTLIHVVMRQYAVEVNAFNM